MVLQARRGRRLNMISNHENADLVPGASGSTKANSSEKVFPRFDLMLS